MENSEGIELRVSFDKLQKVVDFEANKSVGEILKRFDLLLSLKEEKDIEFYKDRVEFLKKIIREILYERYRDFRDTLVTVGIGLPTPKKWAINSQEKK